MDTREKDKASEEIREALLGVAQKITALMQIMSEHLEKMIDIYYAKNHELAKTYAAGTALTGDTPPDLATAMKKGMDKLQFETTKNNYELLSLQTQLAALHGEAPRELQSAAVHLSHHLDSSVEANQTLLKILQARTTAAMLNAPAPAELTPGQIRGLQASFEVAATKVNETVNTLRQEQKSQLSTSINPPEKNNTNKPPRP